MAVAVIMSDATSDDCIEDDFDIGDIAHSLVPHDQLLAQDGIDPVHYAQLVAQIHLPAHLADARIASVSDMCLESFPCQHSVRLEGAANYDHMDAFHIAKLNAQSSGPTWDVVHFARQVLKGRPK